MLGFGALPDGDPGHFPGLVLLSVLLVKRQRSTRADSAHSAHSSY